MAGGDTVWVLGDQLNRSLGALKGRRPGEVHVLLVESAAKLASKPWHRQRAHLVLASMRRFAAELRGAGFTVDHRREPSLEEGLEAHRREHGPQRVLAMEPASAPGLALLQRLGVETVRSDQFLCHYEDFAAWAARRPSLRMEDFYRDQRRRLGYLMDGDQPAGGRWNFDHDNREPPPRDGGAWPRPPRSRLDGLDAAVLADLPDTCWGDPPDGTWPTSRRQALARLRHAVENVLPRFGPHEDAMVATSWHLAHTLLSSSLNLGLLTPGEVCDAVEVAYRQGRVPIASAEGFIRQVIGWREYVWGCYWLWREDFRTGNGLEATSPLPVLFTGGPTRMRCVSHAMTAVREHGWTHHIHRLMIFGNLCLLTGIEPMQVNDWMWSSFVDGAEWVMLPNVVGMALHADGGRMMTKPYAAGGAYIDRMSDYCGECPYDRRRRTGDDACPFTTLYWDFMARHADRLRGNHRMAQQVRAVHALRDITEVRERAVTIRAGLEAGTV